MQPLRNHVLPCGINLLWRDDLLYSTWRLPKRKMHHQCMPPDDRLRNYLLRSGRDVLRRKLVLPYGTNVLKRLLYKPVHRLRDDQRSWIYELRVRGGYRQLLPARRVLFGFHSRGVLPPKRNCLQ